MKGGEILIKFSVVIPLYNKEPHIKRALDSVINQTVQDFEIIVVNDGSTDKSADVVKSFSDARIRLINQKNAGVSVARNRGINEAKSELIAFLDADDEWMPDYLETILRLREKYPYAGLYATSLKTEFIDNVLMDKDKELRKLIPDEGLILNFFKVNLKDISHKDIFYTSSVTVPKKIFLEIGGFQTGFWWGEDIDMWGRIALKYPFAYSSQVCAVYYQNVVNSAAYRRKPVKGHPLLNTGKEALKLGNVSPEIVKDFEEYLKFVEMCTAKHNVEAGDKNLALNLLIRKDIKLSYKKLLISTIVSTMIETNFPAFSQLLFGRTVSLR
ncbi:glycosyltransferase family A protein [Methanosarcina barkeri]|uniref:glycosyltransferase family 2 protein n=1 Tax=Methanosarcina barkeri TaxID=2208 RepID=UPI000695B6AD|nr:glycosyltransferase family A protein [Methanosarcina barkeri]